MSDLKSAGLKDTAPRRAVIEILNKEDSPVDVGHIVAHVQRSNLEIDQATIYRILDAFRQKGIISRVEFGEGKYRYELKKEDHHHLVCTKCGRIEDIDDSFMKDMEDKIQEERGFLVKEHNLEFFGICKTCQA